MIVRDTSIGPSDPSAWYAFRLASRSTEDLATCGFRCDFGHLARWRARFRLARSFRGLDLGAEYVASGDTPALYSAITRVFLAYSAFETYARCLGHKPANEAALKGLQDSSGQSSVLCRLRQDEPLGRIWAFVADHLTDARLVSALRDFPTGIDVNVSFLARCIRHVFAHGVLAAHSTGLDESQLRRVTSEVAEFLLRCMEADFESRTKDLTPM